MALIPLISSDVADNLDDWTELHAAVTGLGSVG